MISSDAPERPHIEQRNRRYYGLDAMLLTGDMAQAFSLPQPGGFLVKQVAENSIAARLGLRGGDRMGIVDGQSVVVSRTPHGARRRSVSTGCGAMSATPSGRCWPV